MFREQTGEDISYEAILSPLDGFASTIENLRKEGFNGCNVTVPFKHEAFQLSEPTHRANVTEAVNTLKFESGKIIGDNTDGIGLIRDIEQNLGIQLRNKRILLIGAGGAAHGVLHLLLEAAQAPLVIYNRTLEKAVSLKKVFEQSERFSSHLIMAVQFGKLGKEQFDVVINATSAGLTGSEIPLPETVFSAGALAYDMMYGRETPFMKFSRAHGAAVVTDGLGMLVEQAAESFLIWRGVNPDTAPVITALRNQQ